jgi:hypothetical protein
LLGVTTNNSKQIYQQQTKNLLVPNKMANAGAGENRNQNKVDDLVFMYKDVITRYTPIPEVVIPQDMHFDFRNCVPYNDENIFDRNNFTITYSSATPKSFDERQINVKSFIKKCGGIDSLIDIMLSNKYYGIRNDLYREGVDCKTRDDLKILLESDELYVRYQLIRHKSKRNIVILSVNTELIYETINRDYSSNFIVLRYFSDHKEDRRALRFLNIRQARDIDSFINKFFVKRIKDLRDIFGDSTKMSLIKNRLCARTDAGLGR